MQIRPANEYNMCLIYNLCLLNLIFIYCPALCFFQPLLPLFFSSLGTVNMSGSYKQSVLSNVCVHACVCVRVCIRGTHGYRAIQCKYVQTEMRWRCQASHWNINSRQKQRDFSLHHPPLTSPPPFLHLPPHTLLSSVNLNLPPISQPQLLFLSTHSV